MVEGGGWTVEGGQWRRGMEWRGEKLSCLGVCSTSYRVRTVLAKLKNFEFHVLLMHRA